MREINTVQDVIMLVLCVASVGLTGFAAIDSVRRRANLFPAVGRQTKVFWVALLAAALLLTIYFLYDLYALSIFNAASVVAAGVYLADVRPKLQQISRGRGSSGPYGSY